MKPIRLMIADDHPIFRDGLRALLASVEDIEITAEATTGDEAVALALSEQPDLVLMDLKMPGLNGIEAARRINQANPSIRVLMLTMFDDEDSLFAAMRAGVRGYLLKGARQEEALRAIRAVANGEVIFGPQLAEKIAHFFTAARSTAPRHLLPELTEREVQILNLLAQGLRNAEIASRLNLSPKTVRNYISNIFDKLQVNSRAEAVWAARTAGLGDQADPDHH